MCGRYAIFSPPHRLKDLFGTDNLLNVPPRYNAAPLQELPIIIHNRMGMARWGFVPEWAKRDDKSMAAKMINARSETVSEKPSFRGSWARRRRCLIPVSGFYEWKKDPETGLNQPYYIADSNRDCLVMAGLWSKNADLLTFTILTKPADGDIAGLHHRMPVMIPTEQAAAWFTASDDMAKDIIGAATAQNLAYYPVGTAVGKVADDSADLIKRAS